MPKRINLCEAGLRRSPRLKENDASSSINHKAHVTFGAIFLKTVSFFALLFNVKDSIPSISDDPFRPNYSFTARTVYLFHELN